MSRDAAAMTAELQLANEQLRADLLNVNEKLARYQQLYAIYTTENKALVDENLTLDKLKQHYQQANQVLEQKNITNESAFRDALAKKDSKIVSLKVQLIAAQQETPAKKIERLATELSSVNRKLDRHHYQNEIIPCIKTVNTLKMQRFLLEEELAELRNTDELSGNNERYDTLWHKPRDPKAGDIEYQRVVPAKTKGKSAVTFLLSESECSEKENRNSYWPLFRQAKKHTGNKRKNPQLQVIPRNLPL